MSARQDEASAFATRTWLGWALLVRHFWLADMKGIQPEQSTTYLQKTAL